MLTYLIIFVLLLVAEVVYFKIAAYFQIVDHPNRRSSHAQPIIRGGGIIFLLAVWLWVAFFGWSSPWFIVGVTLISIVSYLDDLSSESKSVRLVVQFASMLMLFHQHEILTPNTWWVLAIELVFCVGIINAFNFMDGINGILGTYSIVVLGVLLYLDTLGLESVTGLTLTFVPPSLLVVVLLAAFVFCLFNYRNHARCFSGDVGSVGMAFIIVFSLGWLIIQTGDFTYIMLLSVFGVDSALTIFHRMMLHENITEPHRKHAYQLMANELKIPHVVVSSFYAGLQLLIAAGLVFLPMNRWVYSGIVLAALCLAYYLFMKKYYHLHEDYLKKTKA